MRFSLTILFLILFQNITTGQETFLISNENNLDQHVEVISQGTYDLNVYQHPEHYKWEKLPKSTYSLAPFSKPHWYRFRVKSFQSIHKLLIYKYEMIPELDVFIHSTKTNQFKIYHLGTEAYKGKKRKSINLRFQPGEIKTVYFRVYGKMVLHYHPIQQLFQNMNILIY